MAILVKPVCTWTSEKDSLVLYWYQKIFCVTLSLYLSVRWFSQSAIKGVCTGWKQIACFECNKCSAAKALLVSWSAHLKTNMASAMICVDAGAEFECQFDRWVMSLSLTYKSLKRDTVLHSRKTGFEKIWNDFDNKVVMEKLSLSDNR